jgi:hypothetical protein
MTPRRKAPTYASVTVKTLKLTDIHEASYNARTIGTPAMKGLQKSLERFGVLSFPVVNVKDGINRIISGHQRIRALRAAGKEAVPCILVTFDEVTEQRANFTLNNRAIQGEFIPEMTREVLQKIQALSPVTYGKIAEEIRLNALLKDCSKSQTHTKGVDDVARSGKTADDSSPSLSGRGFASEAGRFYRLGEHTIYCGKLVDAGSLDGFPVKSADAAVCQFTSVTDSENEAIAIYAQHTLQNTSGPIHIACASESLPGVLSTFKDLGGHVSCIFVAYDPRKAKQGEEHGAVAMPIVYGWREDGARAWYGGAAQGDVQACPNLDPSDMPVSVASKLILNTTKSGNTVLDCDTRRGATLIACEKLGRRLIGYCSTPREMDLLRMRWTEFVHGAKADWHTATGEVQ